ncbi:hypothetical protein FS837_010343 [Tulasnella sp. UAMH 9824]|nr:hypothetical protein FS837_010343 [Tulasnella sp. UAMH 9824]
MHSLIRGLLSTILLLALSQQAASQSVVVSTSYSQAVTFTGNRVLATVSVPIPITMTVAGAASPAASSNRASNAGGTVVTVGGNSQSVSNGGVVTVGASQASGAASNGGANASSTPTTTYPAAPAATIDPNSVAPYPGQTNAAGQVLGPDDSYHVNAGFRTVETGVAFAGTFAAVLVGGAQLIHLL